MTESELRAAIAVFRQEVEDIVPLVVQRYYFKGGETGVPYSDTTDVKDNIPVEERQPYMTVNITGEEYWFLADLETLVLKVENLSGIVDRLGENTPDGSIVKFLGLDINGKLKQDILLQGITAYIKNQITAAQAGNMWISGTVKAGSLKIGSETDYLEIEADGTLQFYGNATVWDDVKFDSLTLNRTGNGISLNLPEMTIDYLATADINDYMVAAPQLPHSKKQGAVIKPHIHFQQDRNFVPNFALVYRWQKNDALKTTVWTAIKCNTLAFTYPGSGTFNQIASTAAGITPPEGENISDIIQFKIIRDTTNQLGLNYTTDPYNAVVAVLSFDVHVEINSLGSRTEISDTPNPVIEMGLTYLKDFNLTSENIDARLNYHASIGTTGQVFNIQGNGTRTSASQAAFDLLTTTLNNYIEEDDNLT